MQKIKIEKGQELITTLEKEFAKNNLSKGGFIVIGAVDEACISNMPKDDASQDILTEYKLPMELSGTGEIREGKPHIHACLSSQGDKAIHGHLHWAKIKTWYVSVYLI